MLVVYNFNSVCAVTRNVGWDIPHVGAVVVDVACMDVSCVKSTVITRGPLTGDGGDSFKVCIVALPQDKRDGATSGRIPLQRERLASLDVELSVREWVLLRESEQRSAEAEQRGDERA